MSQAQALRKVMQVIGAKAAGGAETYYLRLIKALNEQVAIIPVVRRHSWIAEQLTRQGIAFEALGFGGALDMTTGVKLKALVRKYRPSIIQGWMSRAMQHMPVSDVPVVARLGGYYDLKYYRRADWLVGNTEDICTWLRGQGWSQERVVYVPNFAPAPARRLSDEERSAMRREVAGGAGARMLFIAGRLHENKGIDIALQALREVPEDVHLVIAGDGPLHSQLEAQGRGLGVAGRVHFLGWRTDIDRLAGAMDVWLVPSRHEPLGNVVLDAWMQRVPVIATRTHGPESLIEDGRTGRLVPIDDAAALAHAIRALLADPPGAVAMAAAGHERAQTAYAEPVVVERWLALYERAIAAGKA